MTLEQFAQKWLGGRTDYDKVYAYQCVDLILQYLAEVHGIRQGVWGNAIDYWTKPTATLLQSFEKVTGRARAGDIVILNATSTNPYGHIMIAMNDTTAIEQNGATGDGDGQGGDEVRYRTIPYTRVAGLLRKKGTEDVIKKEDLGPIRVVMSEVEGWNGHEIHSGKHDNTILGAWVGKTWTEFIQHCWDVQKTHRIHLEETIGNLSNRPTRAQYDALALDKQKFESQVGELVRVRDIQDGQIKKLTDEKAVLEAKLGDANLTVKQAIKVLYQTVIDAIKS